MSKHNAKEWIGILNAFQDAGYLSIKTFLKLSEGVARNFNVSSKDMINLINEVHSTYDDSVSEASVVVKWKTDKPTDEATQWAGIIATMEHEKYLSIAGTVSFAEDVARNFKLKWNDMAELINYAHKNVDYEKSYAYADVYWK